MGFIAMAGRVHLMTGVDNVGEANVLYMDTDSIFTLKKLNDNYICQKTLGKWKLEGQFDNAFFLAPKMYSLININEDQEMKYTTACKGIKNKELINFSFLQNIIEKNRKTLVNKNIFTRKKEGSVVVHDQLKTITLTNSKRKQNEDIIKEYDEIIHKYKINSITLPFLNEAEFEQTKSENFLNIRKMKESLNKIEKNNKIKELLTKKKEQEKMLKESGEIDQKINEIYDFEEMLEKQKNDAILWEEKRKSIININNKKINTKTWEQIKMKKLFEKHKLHANQYENWIAFNETGGKSDCFYPEFETSLKIKQKNKNCMLDKKYSNKRNKYWGHVDFKYPWHDLLNTEKEERIDVSGIQYYSNKIDILKKEIILTQNCPNHAFKDEIVTNCYIKIKDAINKIAEIKRNTEFEYKMENNIIFNFNKKKKKQLQFKKNLERK